MLEALTFYFYLNKIIKFFCRLKYLFKKKKRIFYKYFFLYKTNIATALELAKMSNSMTQNSFIAGETVGEEGGRAEGAGCFLQRTDHKSREEGWCLTVSLVFFPIS